MRLGLAANRLHHHTEDAALFRWLRASGAGLRELDVTLHTVGRTFDAIVEHRAFETHAGLVRYPNVQIRIEGNADERGTREYNLALGARRAEADLCRVRSGEPRRGVDKGVTQRETC